jgi:4-aminobutyrate aminotransferase-like enzyme
VTIGKGLGNGLPITAVLVDAQHRDQVAHIEGGTTYGGNPVSCAAAVATITAVLANDLPQRASVIGSLMLRHLNTMRASQDCIGDVRGLGCLAGIEFVVDKGSRTPDPDRANAVYKMACDRGLLTTQFGNVIRLTPPLTVAEDSVERAMQILGESIAVLGNGQSADAAG